MSDSDSEVESFHRAKLVWEIVVAIADNDINYPDRIMATRSPQAHLKSLTVTRRSWGSRDFVDQGWVNKTLRFGLGYPESYLKRTLAIVRADMPLAREMNRELNFRKMEMPKDCVKFREWNICPGTHSHKLWTEGKHDELLKHLRQLDALEKERTKA